ncbi:RNA-binding protein spenito [Centruroides vittatus]|uniref:RNA-binding protein spenito n=1 Tax=Centruroides vittatus TaxID=120091 RepID=UPI0035101FDB
MKRQQDRDSPIKTKRSHNDSRTSSRYDDSPRDRGTPDRRDRRTVNKSPSERRGRSRERTSIERSNLGMNRTSVINRDLYDDYPRSAVKQSYTYKVLCVSNLNNKVNDSSVRDALQREFGRHGEVTVKLCHDSNERIAYLYFRSGDDARDARHAKSRLVLFDKPVHVEPVLDRAVLPGSRRNRSVSPDYTPSHGVRGISPAHSTASTSSVGRRPAGGRHNCLDRSVPPPYPPPSHREPPRRDVREFHHMSHRREESKKEKFPNYLHHVPPEEDDKATRTLFVGNLEVSISEVELRRIFERYGVVEDIDVKRPPPGQGNAYAFIKFLNLDMAHRAKVEMSGQYIGKFQCKIGYGKATPTTRIWVGGLGPWTSLSHLEREFDRFGAIRKIDFVKGENHAYIQYDSIDAAQAACQEMRGFPLGGQDKRLRVDFADPGPYSYYQSPSRGAGAASGSYRDEDHYVPSRRSGNRDMASSDDFYEGLDNHWQRNSTYHNNAQYDLHYDRLPRQSRDQWQPELDDRHDGDYRGGWNRNWWDDHPRSRNDGTSERRKRPRTPDDDGPQDCRTGRSDDGISYKHARRSNTPDQGEQERVSVRDPISPRRNRENSNRRTSKERHSPINYDILQKNDSRESVGKDRDNDDVRDSSNSFGRTRGGKSESLNEDKKKSSDTLKAGSVTVADSVTNLQDLAKCCPVAWHGGLVLKNSAFTSRMHVCSGDPSLVEFLMKDSANEVPMLRITQRLRLDPPKLDDVSRRVSNSGTHGHCMLLTLPGSLQTLEDQSNSVQQRPLRNLVSYLKQKEAAGVVSLPGGGGGGGVKKDGKELTGVLYAFPPCSFALELLRRIAPNLTGDSSKEDHLVVVVVKGST